MSFRKLYGLFMKSFALSCTVFALQFTACSSSPTVTVPTDSITAAVSPSAAVQPTGAPSLSTAETPNVDTHPSPTPEGSSTATITPSVHPTQTPVPTETVQPTPEPENPVTFSIVGGFYENPFNVSLSAEPDCSIFYTTDGSDPRTSETSLAYDKEIFIYNNSFQPNILSAVEPITLCGYQPPQTTVEKGILLRAVSKAPDGSFGPVNTQTYFVGKEASYYKNLKVLSIATDFSNLFDPDTGVYMIGSGFYEWRNSKDFVFYDPGDVLNPTNYNADGPETEFPVALQVFENGTLSYAADLGARICGNWSRANAQKSFRLYARKEYGPSKIEYDFFDHLKDFEGKEIQSFDKLTLRNAGNDNQTLHFRDVLFHELVKDLSPDTMAAEPCVLFLDGEFWGFYMIREKTDGNYIKSHYGLEKKDIAIVKNGELDAGTKEDLEEFRKFCEWAMYADMTVDANYQRFCKTIDIQSFMDYMTVQTYLCNNDFAYGGMNNWQAWRSKSVHTEIPKADTKWRFIFYDLDYAAGLYGSTQTAYNYDTLGKMHSSGTDFNLPAILKNACKNDTFRQLFYENYVRIIDTCFNSELVINKIDEFVTAYEEVTKATFFRFGIDWAAYSYEGNVEQLKNFFRLRPGYAKQYLDAYCGVKSEEVPST